MGYIVEIKRYLRDFLTQMCAKLSLAGDCNTPNERNTGVKIEVTNGAP